MQARMLVASFIVIQGLVACAHTPAPSQHGDLDACVAGKECTFQGKLSLFAGQVPAWVALVEAKGKCVKLALPDEFYKDKKKWDGKTITVSGRAFEQPSFDESSGAITLWYTEQDRKLALGMCDNGLGIYVDTMHSASGQTWPGSS